MGTRRLCGRVLVGGFLVGTSSPPSVSIFKVSLTLPLVGWLLLFALNDVLFVRLSPKRLYLVGAFRSLCLPMRVGSKEISKF